MKRINTVLKASEAAEVEKAVSEAGAVKIVLFPVIRGAETRDWDYGSLPFRESQVRLEATAEDNRCDFIIAAIIGTARAGKIEALSFEESAS